MFKTLFILLLCYYLYRSVIKPMLGSGTPKEEEPKIRYREPDQSPKKGNDEDYIDYEEVE